MQIRHLSEVKNGRYVVAVDALDEARIVGHAMLDPMVLRSTAHIAQLTIVVHAGFEGRGIGRALMNHLIDWARGEPSVQKVELRVRHENERAIRLYRSLGFSEEGRFERRIKLADGRYLDDVAMALWVGDQKE
jgi:ribosomal protein S18 acetylase RimI-like enzyme